MTPARSIATIDLAHLNTKSAKIRYLKDLGYRQADIARHLGVLDQHVSNVVRGPRPKSEIQQTRRGVAEVGATFGIPDQPLPIRVVVGRDGAVRFPDSWGVPGGSVFIARKFGGSIVLMDLASASNAARTGESTSATDDLIAERRLDAMREFDD